MGPWDKNGDPWSNGVTFRSFYSNKVWEALVQNKPMAPLLLYHLRHEAFQASNPSFAASVVRDGGLRDLKGVQIEVTQKQNPPF